MNSEKITILIVDDEPSLVEILEYNLKKEGYSTISCGDGEKALKLFNEKPVSLIVLDIMMPGLNGLEVCREIRKKSYVPIIMLTAKSGETNKVVGLELGADDYVTKPFSVIELIARIKAVLRRTQTQKRPDKDESEDMLVRGDLSIDKKRRLVLLSDAPVELTAREFDLLFFLASNPGIVFTREQILDKVWRNESIVVDRAVDVHIRHLREKLETEPDTEKYISTLRGVGYRFNEIK